jgi:hypothetical protein
MELVKEVNDEFIIISEINKPRGRPKGTFKENKIVDKDYYKNYYHKTCGDVICECGLKTNKRNLARHMKTKKHLEILQIQKNI